MKYLLLPLLLISFHSYSQCKQFVIGPKGDTLNCVDVKGLKQGRWVIHVAELRGEPGYEEEGRFVDGNREGTWRRFSLEGDQIAIENYRWGFKDGRNVYFNRMGDLLREESWRAVDPKNPYDTVNVTDPNDPTLIIGQKVVKIENVSLKHGTWKYYDPSRGTIEKTENWVMDKPLVKASEEDDLAPIDVTAEKKTTAKPKEVLDFEKKNAGKKKIKVRTGSTGG
jgi:hypothetical protein